MLALACPAFFLFFVLLLTQMPFGGGGGVLGGRPKTVDQEAVTIICKKVYCPLGPPYFDLLTIDLKYY